MNRSGQSLSRLVIERSKVLIGLLAAFSLLSFLSACEKEPKVKERPPAEAAGMAYFASKTYFKEGVR